MLTGNLDADMLLIGLIDRLRVEQQTKKQSGNEKITCGQYNYALQLRPALIRYYVAHFLIMFPFYKQAKLKQFSRAACSAVARERESKGRK